MFAHSQFNTDISRWDVSSGIDFSGMFSYAVFFDKDISGWDVSSGAHFDRMFYNAFRFSQILASWPERAKDAEDFCTNALMCGYD